MLKVIYYMAFGVFSRFTWVKFYQIYFMESDVIIIYRFRFWD